MYLPRHFEQNDPAALHALLREHPLATWVTQGGDAPGGLVVNHVPFMLDATRGPHGTLIGHVARANPVWQRPAPSVFVFQGPQAYVSPGWYPSKQAHGKVVPTWNYAVVHAHGTPRVLDAVEARHAIVRQLTETHERGRSQPWSVDDAPPDYVAQMLAAIVAIEIPVERLVGKWKVSQNRSADDRRGVAEGLCQPGPSGETSPEMAAMAAMAVLVRPPSDAA
jgi:transcriptional regulator